MSVKFHRCQALSGDAKLCNRKTNHAESYHGEDELYGYSADTPYPVWVLVWLCDKHRATERRSFKPASKRGASQKERA